MIKKKLIFFGIIFLILPVLGALQTNSSNYVSEIILSSGGDNISSSNYNMNTFAGVIVGNSSSSSYTQSLGLFYTSVESSSSSVSPATSTTPSEGGGGTSVTASGFTLNRDLIKVLIKQGETKREIVEIKNLGVTSLDITLELDGLRRFMAISEESFTLEGKSSKSIFIDIFAKEEEIPEAYTGRIIVKDNTGVIKIINIIIEIKEKRPIFDVRVDLLSKEVSAGRKVKAKFNVVNFGDLENIDILLYYSIKDFEGNLLSFKEESVLIKDELDIVRELRIPKDTLVGDYVFYLRASYGNITASATDSFKVTEKKLISTFLILCIILSLIILLLILMIFKILNHHKKGHHRIKQETKGVFSRDKIKKKKIKEKRIKLPKKIEVQKLEYPKIVERKKVEPLVKAKKKKIKKRKVEKKKVKPIKKVERETRRFRKTNEVSSSKNINKTKKEMYNKLLDTTIKMKKKNLKKRK